MIHRRACRAAAWCPDSVKCGLLGCVTGGTCSEYLQHLTALQLLQLASSCILPVGHVGKELITRLFQPPEAHKKQPFLMVTNGCKKFELPASIATCIAKHNTEGNNEFPIPLLYNLWLELLISLTALRVGGISSAAVSCPAMAELRRHHETGE